MAFGPLKRGPQTDDPIDRQFKIRVREADLETIERMARDGVTLPERKIPPGSSKSELTRIALGLDDPPDTTPGKNALDELTRRVKKRG
jgi:hypothetical protein